ncbi:hypothetical protein B0H19DRAFT_90619 [Mycena capillaripes]|nr:hypothetical protein B0H19DRAFT_90619 [Mycena capillaripes]
MSLSSNAASTGAANKQSSQSIFRKLTTRFTRNRSLSTPPPPRENKRRAIASPQVNNSATVAAREARNAALRARGLLPPLPLSVQEARQDRRIAIVTEPEPDQQSGLDRSNTAANRIKEEWEARNRERLAGFRFGGNSPSASPMQEHFPAVGLHGVREVDTPLPSPSAQDPPSEFGDLDEPSLKAPRAPPPTLNISPGYRLSPPLMQAWSDTSEDPLFFPLPPSPGAESNYSSLISAFAITPTADAGFTPMSPSFLPLPPSPSCSTTAFHTGTETTRVAGDCTPRPPRSPTVASMNSLAPPRSLSFPLLDDSECESSLGVPSLVDSQSHTTVSTAESLASFAHMRDMPLATTVRNSTMEPLKAHQAISVIVETPTEERDAFLSASPVDVVEEPRGPKIAVPMSSEEAPRRRTTVEEPAPQPQPQTPPPRQRRKSLSLFRRGKGEGGKGESGKGESGMSTITSIRTSLGIGRTKSTLSPRAGFDPSHLPPSPTLPVGLATPQRKQTGRPMAAGHKHRLSVSPTMHNDGSILREMNLIENEESRRMTEVAFM